MHNILIVDQTVDPAMKFIDALSRPHVDVTFTSQLTQALKNVKKHDYDLILLGDRTEDGGTYDVALGIKDGRKNKQVPIVCVGVNTGKAVKIMKLLKPYAFSATTTQFETTVGRIKAYLENKE
jgi:DNA-binding response OmpR family regulator